MSLRILWCRIFIPKCTSTLNYWLYYTRNLCQRKITDNMFQINLKRLLLKLTTENTSMLNSNFYKQIDGSTMGGPQSVIFLASMWPKHKKKLLNQQIQCFVKDLLMTWLANRKKDQPDLMFQNLKDHHPNIKYTIETMPQKFPETKII